MFLLDRQRARRNALHMMVLPIRVYTSSSHLPFCSGNRYSVYVLRSQMHNSWRKLLAFSVIYAGAPLIVCWILTDSLSPLNDFFMKP